MQYVAGEDMEDWRDLGRKVYWHAHNATDENDSRRGRYVRDGGDTYHEIGSDEFTGLYIEDSYIPV